MSDFALILILITLGGWVALMTWRYVKSVRERRRFRETTCWIDELEDFDYEEPNDGG